MWTPRKRIIILGSVLLGLSVAITAAAKSTAEYSATSITETADGKIEGMIYHAGDKERRESNIEGEKTTLIIRHDKHLIWMLMPEEHAYIKMKLGESPDKGDVSGFQIKQTIVGPETIDGIKTTKSKIIAKNPKGEKFGGFWWTTKEGIVIKMDMISVEKGSKQRIKTQLSNLKIGKQDPGLFEIPAGYSAMNMGIQGIKDMMGEHNDTQSNEQNKPADKNDKGSGFGLKDIYNILK